MKRVHIALLLVAQVSLLACGSSNPPPAPGVTAAQPQAQPPASTPDSPDSLAPMSALHPWPHAAADERLYERFAAPAGFRRVAVELGSFGEFLRTLPLAPAGTPVVDYRGRRLYGEEHPNIAAVVDIDVGDRDLQQCADAVIRMNAEWHFGRGDTAIAYRTFSGATLSFAKYLAGERAYPDGTSLSLRATARPVADDHRALRSFLDEVFNYANTWSLAREGSGGVALEDVRGGDFFVMPESPFGHSVLVLDVARDDGGRTALLLGQSYMPAQSFQVLRPRPSGVWFVLPPGATEVATPFWRPFPLSTLRRMG